MYFCCFCCLRYDVGAGYVVVGWNVVHAIVVSVGVVE